MTWWSKLPPPLRVDTLYSVNFVLHKKVHVNYMTGVTSSHHKSSLSSSLVPRLREKMYIHQLLYVHKHCERRYTIQYYWTIIKLCKNNTGNEKLTHHIWSPHIIMVYIITMCVCCKRKINEGYRVRVQQLVYNYEKLLRCNYVCWKACKGYIVCIITVQHTIITKHG